MARSSSRASAAKPAATPVAKPASTSNNRSAQTLLNQYQSALSGGVGQGTEGNPLGDFTQGAQALWNQSQNLRDYSAGLRSDTRAHEMALTNAQSKSQENIAAIGASAQKFGAAQSASASKFGAKAGADASMYGDRLSADAQKYAARMGAEAQRHSASESARASITTARMGTDAQRYSADIGYKASLAGNASQERVAAGAQAGENFRTKLQVAGDLLKNKADNETAQSGQLYDYTARVRATQWRAPDVSNIRYWGS